MHRAQAQAQRLKSRVRALTNRGLYQPALERLDSIVDLLRGAIDEHDPRDTESLGELQSELADTLGMKGGILRRDGRASEALKAYREGLESEAPDSTYNLSNEIVLSVVLGDTALDDPGMQQRLQRVITKLEGQTSGPRGDEWWAWADLAQFYLLAGEPEQADRCYRAGRDAGPGEREYNSTLAVLEQLKAAPAASTVADDIDDAVAKLKRYRAEVAVGG